MKLDMSNYSLSEIETVLEILFSKDWKSAEIEESDYPFGTQYMSPNRWSIRRREIWNHHGLIYRDGVFATAKIKKLPKKYILKEGGSFKCPKYGTSSCNLIDWKGFRYITEWQHKELIDEPKIGDFGIFHDFKEKDTMILFGQLTDIGDLNDMCPYSDEYNERWNYFTPIKNKEHIEIIKSYLK